MRFAATIIFTCTLCMDAFADRIDEHARNDYAVTVLVSNQAGEAPTTDPKLVNAWGIAAGPTTPWWVADNGTGMATIYLGDGTKASLEVTVPGAPTGTVWNGSMSFELAPGKPAIFLFASEDGTISGWNPGVDATHALVVESDAEAVYKGLAILGNHLYTTNFTGCAVEVLDTKFTEIDVAGGFADRSIPKGYCPFGIQAIGDALFVTYALADGMDDVPGRGHGFVREFDADGHLRAEVASRGALNSPWGMAMAPAGFGRFSGCLLVGNFGDGHLNAYCRERHEQGGRFHHEGTLREAHRTLVIDGLWGIGFGNGNRSGPTNVLYFAAGPDDEQNGLFGKIDVGPASCRR